MVGLADMGNTMESSAVAYAGGGTLKAAVSFACLLGGAEKMRDSIKSGSIPGISFAPPKERKKRVALNARQRKAKVIEVNELRDGGMKKTAAILEAQISASAYEKWSVDAGIKYTEVYVDRYPHDVAVAELVAAGETITQACSTFGLESQAWRERAIKKGLYVPNNRNKPRAHYADRVAAVKKAVRDTGCTIRAACAELGFPEYDYNRYKLLAD